MNSTVSAGFSTSTSEFVALRGLRMHVRTWGPQDAPALFLLHGWQDFSASFQFLVDAFSRNWRCIALDWRGFGLSEWNHDCYWFPDYVADLDALLAHYSPDAPATLIGHSMGGNAACVYAGVRPQRVARLVSLEGFGLPASDPDGAPERYARWLDQLRAVPENRCYADHAALALRLQRLNPRLTDARAAFLATHFGVPAQADRTAGEVVVASDPHHKLSAPYPFRLEEAKACWRRVTADTLWLAGHDSYFMKLFQGVEGEADFSARLGCFRNIRMEWFDQAGHNLHHDQPERLAELIEDFLA